MRGKVVPLGIALAALTVMASAWVLRCSGPSPSLQDVVVRPPVSEGEPYRVETTVRNERAGSGEVEVTVRLRDMRTGIVFQGGATAWVEDDETVIVVVTVEAPSGDYEHQAEVDYPVD
jgi:hypothetical protein